MFASSSRGNATYLKLSLCSCDFNCLGGLYKQQQNIPFCGVALPASDWLLQLLFSDFGTEWLLPPRLWLALRFSIVNLENMGKKPTCLFFLPKDGMDLETGKGLGMFYIFIVKWFAFIQKSRVMRPERKSKGKNGLICKESQNFRVSHSLGRKTEEQRLTGTPRLPIN